MPYIKKPLREKYDEVLADMPPIETKGDLEYCICRLMARFMSTREQRYSTLHECGYAAEHCAHEFVRRFLDKREDVAMAENEDVFDWWKDTSGDLIGEDK